MKLVKAQEVIITTTAKAVRIRTDNGPGTSTAKPCVAEAKLPGVGMVKFRSDGRIVEADASTATALEAARYYNMGIGAWRVLDPLPDAGSPGLAFPNACRENPAPCGGGLAIAYGDPAPVRVLCMVSDYETKRPHPAYPHQICEVNS